MSKIRAWHKRPLAPFSISRAVTEKSGRFIVLKWSECSLNPCGTNLLYLINESLCVTGLQACGWRGRSFQRLALHTHIDTSHKVSSADLQTSAPHCVCIHLNLAKVFKRASHLLSSCSRDFVQSAAYIIPTCSSAQSIQKCKHFLAILFPSLTVTFCTGN